MPSLLPSEPQAPSRRKFSRARLLIIGDAKTGKSTLVSEFPKCLVLDCENGYVGLGTFVSQVRSRDDLELVLSEIETRDASGTLPYHWIALDSISALYTFCSQQYCAKNNVTTEADVAFGKGPPIVNADFKMVISRLLNLRNCGVILVGHTCVELKSRNGREVNSEVLMIPTVFKNAAESPRNFVMSLVDQVFQLVLDCDGNRVIHTARREWNDAGGRYGDVLPPEIPFKLGHGYQALAEPFMARAARDASVAAGQKEEKVG